MQASLDYLRTKVYAKFGYFQYNTIIYLSMLLSKSTSACSKYEHVLNLQLQLNPVLKEKKKFKYIIYNLCTHEYKMLKKLHTRKKNLKNIKIIAELILA